MACAGSFAMSELYAEDQEQSEEAIEGTLAAAVAAGRVLGKPFLHPEITDEMLEFADQWTEICGPIDNNCFIESWVDGSAIHPDCFGTPDFYRIDRENRVVYVKDYKFGHKPVNKWWQLITYAICIKTWLELDDCWTFELAYFQPRAMHRDGPYRTITVVADLLNEWLCEIQYQIDLALSDEALCKVGDGCYMCPAAHRCEALQKASSTLAEWFASDTTPFDLTPEQESSELDRLELAHEIIKNRITAIKQSIIGGLKHGKEGYSYVLESQPGREVWRDGLETVKILEALYNVTLVTEKPITPKQAIAKKIPAEVVRQYSTTPMQKEQLVKFKSKFNGES
jgi:hypothetical protein